MAFDYEDLGLTADDLLREFGVLVTFKSHSAGDYDTSTGIVSGDNDTSFSVYAAFIPWESIYIDGKKYEWHDQFHSGSGVKLDDIRCLMSPVASNGSAITSPKQGDKVTASGNEYQVIAVKPIQPALVPVLFDVALRA